MSGTVALILAVLVAFAIGLPLNTALWRWRRRLRAEERAYKPHAPRPVVDGRERGEAIEDWRPGDTEPLA